MKLRRLLLLTACASTVLFVGPASPASAGGGGACAHADGPSAFTDARGTRVEMRDVCFTPTVLRVDVGDEVTFANDDPMIHGVGGVGGSFGEMFAEITGGDDVRHTFEDEGVYPYVCIFHPGMAGAIVVGDGDATGASATDADAAGAGDAAAAPGGSDAAAPTSESTNVILLSVAGIAVALLAVLAVRTVATRRRAVVIGASS